jgi:hypothetical protein
MNAHALAARMEEMWARAEREGRDLTASERTHMQELVDATKQQHSIEQEIKGLFTNGGGPSFATVTASDPSHSFAGGGPGDVFVKSAAYQRIAAGDRGQTWSTGPVEVSSGRLLTKGTLLETGAGGPGGGLVPPQYEPGVVSKLFEPLGVADVFGRPRWLTAKKTPISRWRGSANLGNPVGTYSSSPTASRAKE